MIRGKMMSYVMYSVVQPIYKYILTRKRKKVNALQINF